MIHLKSADELKKMRKAGIITAKVLNRLLEMATPGVTTEQLDKEALKLLKKFGGRSAFYGYQGFPKNICTSVNEEVVHGIPSSKKLKESDIIGIDVGIEVDGYCADAAATVGVGRICEEAKKLIQTTKRALDKAISVATVENRLSDISFAIQNEAEAEGFSVVREFVGHGIGASIHEDPQIPNFGEPHMGPLLKAGMVLAIEPMINIGTYKVQVLQDGWTAVTADRKLSAHFEHTIAITDEGPLILTEKDTE